MTYNEFLQTVEAGGWSLEQLRCDVPPTIDILELIEDVGGDYESFVQRYSQRPTTKPQTRRNTE